MMEETVKAWIEQIEFKNCSRGFDPDAALTRAYGVMMFAYNTFPECENLGNWWDNEMLPKFKQIIEDKKER